MLVTEDRPGAGSQAMRPLDDQPPVRVVRELLGVAFYLGANCASVMKISQKTSLR